MNKETKDEKGKSKEDEQFPLPVYSAEEDIYRKEEEVALDDENEDPSGRGPAADLDIPGSELDDADEAIGEEDEENNYYSLGGDDHNDLDEDKEEDR